MSSKVSVIIFTLNAGSQIKKLLNNLATQTYYIDELIVVDSESDDSTVTDVKEFLQVRLFQIKRSEFDHGRTRNEFLRIAAGDYVIMMTQDALPVDNNAIKNLVEMIESDDRLACCTGRQIAYSEASLPEKYIREFNYPDYTSVWNSVDIATIGYRAYRISDVFAIYRKSSYLEVGGFDYPILTNEDMLIAQKFLAGGFYLGYCAEARVYHSHDFSFAKQYKRNKIIGETLERFKTRFPSSEVGEGVELVKYVTFRLIKGFHLISFVKFGFDCIARFSGNRAGRKKERMHGAQYR